MLHRFPFPISRLALPGVAGLLLLSAPVVGRPTAPDTAQVNGLNRRAERTAEQKNLPLGRQLAAQARTRAHATGYLPGELRSIYIMAKLALEGGDFVAAVRNYTQGIDLAKAKQQTRFYEPFYASLGACALEMEQYAYALELLQTSHRYRRIYPSQAPDTAYAGAEIHSLMARAYQGLGLVEEAMKHCRLTFPAGVNAPSYPDVEVTMAELMRNTAGGRSSAESALEMLETARARYHEQGERHKESRTLLTMSQFLADEGRPFESGQAARKAAAYAESLRAVPIQMKALELQARAAVAEGNYQRAYALLAEASRKKDALFTQEKTNELEKQRAQFLLENQQQQVAALKREREAARNLAEAREGRVRTLNYLLLTAGLFIVVGSFLFGRLRSRRAQLARVYEKLHDTNAQLNDTNAQLEGALVDISQKVEEKEALVQEKQVLVQEIHHRVKNNLLMVSGMLGWQSSSYSDPVLREALASSRAQIHNMAEVHQQLYQSENLAEVRLDSYITQLLGSLQLTIKSNPCPVTITTDLDPLVMPAPQASSLGFLINELVTNAYKHAFVGRSSGKLHVELRRGPAGVGFRLQVTDDGVGMPEAGVERPPSLGTYLIDSMTRSLKAERIVEPNEGGGTRIILLLTKPFDNLPREQPVMRWQRRPAG